MPWSTTKNQLGLGFRVFGGLGFWGFRFGGLGSWSLEFRVWGLGYSGLLLRNLV